VLTFIIVRVNAARFRDRFWNSCAIESSSAWHWLLELHWLYRRAAQLGGTAHPNHMRFVAFSKNVVCAVRRRLTGHLRHRLTCDMLHFDRRATSAAKAWRASLFTKKKLGLEYGAIGFMIAAESEFTFTTARQQWYLNCFILCPSTCCSLSEVSLRAAAL